MYGKQESGEMESNCQSLYAAQWTKSNKAAPMGLCPYIYSSLKYEKMDKYEDQKSICMPEMQAQFNNAVHMLTYSVAHIDTVHVHM